MGTWIADKLKWVMYPVIGLLVVYAGVSIYANFIEPRVNAAPVARAEYGLFIRATGQTVLTNSYDLNGSVYTAHGFYKAKGKGYRFVNHDLPIDQDIWGTVDVVKRVK